MNTVVIFLVICMIYIHYTYLHVYIFTTYIYIHYLYIRKTSTFWDVRFSLPTNLMGTLNDGEKILKIEVLHIYKITYMYICHIYVQLQNLYMYNIRISHFHLYLLIISFIIFFSTYKRIRYFIILNNIFCSFISIFCG